MTGSIAKLWPKVDAGPEPAPALTCLVAAGIDAVPLLVLTHYHADHVGGATEIIARFRPGLVLVRGGAVPAWLSAAAGPVDPPDPLPARDAAAIPAPRCT